MRKHLALGIAAVIVVVIAALVLSGRDVVVRKDAPGGDSSSSSSGYHLVTIAEMGITLELPSGWTDGETNDPLHVRIFMDPPTQRRLMILATPATGKDFTAALADADRLTGTAYEGQASVRVEREDPLIIAGKQGAFRHRELLAAGMKDLAAIFEVGDYLFTVSLHHDDGSAPTTEDEALLRSVALSVKALQ